MPRYQTTVAGRVALALRNSGKEIIHERDIDELLESMFGIVGKQTLPRYHELIQHRYLERVSGGWQLKQESKETVTITIKISPPQNTREIMLHIDAALSQYRGLVTTEMDV